MIQTTFSCAEKDAAQFNVVKVKLTRRMARIAEDFAENLPKGFQSIIEIDDCSIVEYNCTTDFNGPDHPYIEPKIFSLRMSDGTSGSFAEAKISTLKYWSNKAATGQIAMSELLDYIGAHPDRGDQCQMLQELTELEDVSQLLRRHHEWLRDQFDLTVFPGGIRVPMTGFNGFRGEIRISFSALTAEQDVAMCVMLLRYLQDAFKEATGDDWYEYDLGALRKIPMVNFYLTMYDVHNIA